VARDPYYSSVVLSLHFEGADTSTTFTDSSSYVQTCSAVQQAQIATAQSKFGSSSARFDGTLDRVLVTDHSTLNFGSSDFTVELWVRIDSTPAVNFPVFAKEIDTGGTAAISMSINTDLAIGILGSTNGGASHNLSATSAASQVTSLTWTHLALERKGSTFTGYVNGVSKCSVTDANPIATNAGPFIVGTRGNGSGAKACYIDDFRVTRLARYQANFTPDTIQGPDVGPLIKENQSRPYTATRSVNLPFNHLGI
jgi:Concanavalin A-like lectin/glucanases superfamily